ncbi:Uncharacterised protein [Mycobacterium tuberculosis]|nr:Uncharacterised protein [Mycobacterium tuberculosis]
MRTRTSLIRSAAAVRPGPSAPTSSAIRSCDTAAMASGSLHALPCGVIANSRKPLSFNVISSVGQSAARAYGTNNACPMDTRTARR